MNPQKRKKQPCSEFAAAVFRVVRRIPRRAVLTYKEVAVRAGRPKAFRAVGNILNGNRDPMIPCHRVIRSDGKLGGYNRGPIAKRRRLLAEGFPPRRREGARPPAGRPLFP